MLLTVIRPDIDPDKIIIAAPNHAVVEPRFQETAAKIMKILSSAVIEVAAYRVDLSAPGHATLQSVLDRAHKAHADLPRHERSRLISNRKPVRNRYTWISRHGMHGPSAQGGLQRKHPRVM